ncbi:MAG TPA: efflux RND transporter periplasmic adaptor subunit [Tepidisphaeraceae bacterium]|nr:efflux RND transporter periplasmic adaptor subunit [Tepidisphaeraceae bacterium]
MKLLSAAIVTMASSVALAETVPGTTAPNKSIEVGFDIRAVVAEVKVTRGQHIKAGELLMRLDDREERATLEVARLRMDVSHQLAEAQARLELAQITYEREKSIHDKGSGTTGLVQEKEAEVKVAQARLAQAQLDGLIAKAQYDTQLQRVEKYSKTSPIDGIVREIIKYEGENVDETRPVIEIVSIDPLYIEVRLLSNDIVSAMTLKQTVRVKYGNSDFKNAFVNFIDPVGDARSGTRFVRLELPNPPGPNMIGAGVTVEIEVPQSVASTESGTNN